VEGRTFHRGAVEALSPTAIETLAPLTALVRRELLRPDRPQLPGEDAFRFRHLLIRDAAYDALPKSTRADLHERFAAWIGDHASDRVELDEIIGYHLEQAHRYRTELGPETAVTLVLAVRAAERLASAGGRAEQRGDVRAATSLLRRAVDLYPPDDPRKLKLLPALGRALTDAGEWDRADAVISEAIEAGNASGDRWLVADATVTGAFVRIHREMDSTHQRIGDDLAAAVKVFDEFGDEAGLARALGFAGNMRIWAGDTTGAIAHLERAVEHARAAGDTVQEETSLSFIVLAILRGPTPAAEGLLRCRELRDRPGLTPRLESSILRCESRFEAMQGNLDHARELNRAAAAIVERPGYGNAAAAIAFESGEIELLAGNPERAEQIMRPAAEILLQTGDYGHYSSYAPWLAQALVLLDRDHEATKIIDLIAENTIDDDLDGQIAWRCVRATLLARNEQYLAAEEVAREAVSLATQTDYTYQQARTHDVLARVLALAGHTHEAVGDYDRAVQLYEDKGDIVDAADARGRRAELQSPARNA
jgi:tetratricopeptide (TPR) repeat protein